MEGDSLLQDLKRLQDLTRAYMAERNFNTSAKMLKKEAELSDWYLEPIPCLSELWGYFAQQWEEGSSSAVQNELDRCIYDYLKRSGKSEIAQVFRVEANVLPHITAPKVTFVEFWYMVGKMQLQETYDRENPQQKINNQELVKRTLSRIYQQNPRVQEPTDQAASRGFLLGLEVESDWFTYADEKMMLKRKHEEEDITTAEALVDEILASLQAEESTQQEAVAAEEEAATAEEEAPAQQEAAAEEDEALAAAEEEAPAAGH